MHLRKSRLRIERNQRRHEIKLVLARVLVNHGLLRWLPCGLVNPWHDLSILQTQSDGPGWSEVFRKVDVSVRFQEASLIPETADVSQL